jgi:hypothetical protein
LEEWKAAKVASTSIQGRHREGHLQEDQAHPVLEGKSKFMAGYKMLKIATRFSSPWQFVGTKSPECFNGLGIRWGRRKYTSHNDK